MLSEHVRTNHPSTSVLRDRVQAALAREAESAPGAALQKINTILLEASATVYPPRPQTRDNRQPDFVPIWTLRDTLRRHWRRDAQGLFQAWKLSHLLPRLARQARSKHIALRRERVGREEAQKPPRPRKGWEEVQKPRKSPQDALEAWKRLRRGPEAHSTSHDCGYLDQLSWADQNREGCATRKCPSSGLESLLRHARTIP